MKKIFSWPECSFSEIVILMALTGLAITLALLLFGKISDRIWADVTMFLFGGGGVFRLFLLHKLGMGLRNDYKAKNNSGGFGPGPN